MRQPASWDDTGLLKDEPFCSVFPSCKRAIGLGHKANSEVIFALDALAKGFQSLDQGGAAHAWLSLAFPDSGFYNGDLQVERPRNEDDFRTFVEFYWRVFQGDKPDRYLTRQRKKRGYEEKDSSTVIVRETTAYAQKNDHEPAAAATTAFTSNPRGRTSEQSIGIPEFQGHSRTNIKHHREVNSMEVPRPEEAIKKPRDTPFIHSQIQVTNSRIPNKTIRHQERIRQGPPQPSNCPKFTVVITREGTIPEFSPLIVQCSQVFPPVVAETFSSPPADAVMHSESLPFPASGSGRDHQAHIASAPNNSGADLFITQDVTTQTIVYNPANHQGYSSPITDHPTVQIHNVSVFDAPIPELAKRDTYLSQDVLLSPTIQQTTDKSPILDSSSWARSSIEHLQPDVVDDVKSNLPLHDFQLSPYYKPPLPNLPPIWAQSRQEVCESFDWFRSYQGGVYFRSNIVKGYLLSAFSSCRDTFEHGGKLIISHGGGGAESVHHRHGQAMNEAAVDQHAQDKSVRALLQNYQEVRPLVLLIDDKYALFPYDLGAKNVTYAVLGFYTITHAWAEYQPANNLEGRVVRYKFAFEWCQGQASPGEPWWLPKIEGDATLRDLPSPGSKRLPVKTTEHKLPHSEEPRPEDIYLTCGTCHEKSPQVYRQQWICLNRMCTRFWVAANGTAPPPILEYNVNFVRLLHLFVLPASLADIRPASPSPPANGITTSHAFTRGWHCRDCGRLSCRYKWECWECSHCKKTVRICGKLHTPGDFWALNFPTTSFHDHSIARNSGIIQEPMKTFSMAKGMGQTQTFVLPGGKGRIHHIQSGARNSEEPDEIFQDYQGQAATGELLFRRWPLRSHKCRGPLLTNYFSQNSGEPYQYVGGTANTVPFSEAPGAVVKAREFIQTRIQQALGIDSTFNEVLSAAYMEGQKMAFHSDAEPGLGPLVAGLSLGSSALIHFRPHSTPKAHPVVISFVLRHGDVLVMDGAGVQRHYEHTVVPTNFRIAATARNIYPTV